MRASAPTNSARGAAAARSLLFPLLLDTTAPRLPILGDKLRLHRSAQCTAPAQARGWKLKAVWGSELGGSACELQTLGDSTLRKKKVRSNWFFQTPAHQ